MSQSQGSGCLNVKLSAYVCGAAADPGHCDGPIHLTECMLSSLLAHWQTPASRRYDCTLSCQWAVYLLQLAACLLPRVRHVHTHRDASSTLHVEGNVLLAEAAPCMTWTGQHACKRHSLI